jgi:hypothetical protein
VRLDAETAQSRTKDPRWSKSPSPASEYTVAVALTSDPHAWLRPYLAALKADPAFTTLATALRFEALRQMVEVDHPDRARQMREWSPAAQTGTLKWLETVTKEKPPVREVEMWVVTKDTRTLRCVARYLPIGIGLRLMQGEDFRRTEVHRDADAVNAKAAEWKAALLERGWE